MEFVRSVIGCMTDVAQLQEYAKEFPFPEGRVDAVRRLHELREYTLLKYMLMTCGRPEVRQEIQRLISREPGRE